MLFQKRKRPTGHHPVFIGLMYRYSVIVKRKKKKVPEKEERRAIQANRPTTKMESSSLVYLRCRGGG